MFTHKQKNEVLEYLDEVPGRVYLGCDSVKFQKRKVWYARYATVLVVHINNTHGCRVFGYTDTDRDFDKQKDKPRMRLMTEVYKVVEIYNEFEDVLIDREVEIHLDVNPKKEYASNAVMKQAVGYVRGVTGIEPLIKNDAWAASFAADWFCK